MRLHQTPGDGARVSNLALAASAFLLLSFSYFPQGNSTLREGYDIFAQNISTCEHEHDTMPCIGKSHQ